MRIVEADAGALLDKAFGKRVSKAGLPDQHALLELDADVRDKRQAPRAAFISYIERIAACFAGDVPRPFGPLHLHRVACVAILDRHRRGGPWKLDERERATLARIPVLRAYFAEHGRLASHRPMIEPDDVLAQLHGDAFDAGALMIVGVVQHHAELTRRAADLFHAGSDWHLAPSPLPAESLPRDVADAVLAAALRAGAPPALMTWGASLANASDATFDATLAALPRERGDFGEHAELALTALRLRDAERFERARDESSAAWAPIFAQAALLADQLAQVEHGQLHPELEMLRRALA
jgi:hypothetical protein